MTPRSDQSLAALNSFGFDQRAAHYLETRSDEALQDAVTLAGAQGWPVFVLGGGTNLVLADDIPGLVIRVLHDHIGYDSKASTVTAGAGVDWHALVLDTLKRGQSGLENLSLIPGSVGAAPVQNIGAYGVELADRFVTCRALHLPTGTWWHFKREACEFGYRQSIFKAHPGTWAITEVTLEVGPHLPLVTHYASLYQRLAHLDADALTAQDVSRCVIAIRQEKLPDPRQIGNAGSFFKNPVTTRTHFEELQVEHPDIVGYAQPDGSVKLAAGWLIDSLGYRGYRRGGIGVHDRQALVLVHRGGETGADLLQLAADIRDAVEVRYGVTLEVEPIIVPGAFDSRTAEPSTCP